MRNGENVIGLMDGRTANVKVSGEAKYGSE